LWWKTAYAPIASSGGWDEVVAADKGNGLFNHLDNAVAANFPIYCIWETKEGFP
tara:strand:+ start:353 stop:514 length:162 start_codon:yes stop_codon:yes gene_type:complete